MSPALTDEYPWTEAPLITCGPMRLIALAPLAVAVSKAGGLGFIGAGEDLRELHKHMQHAKDLLEQSPIAGAVHGVLPIGVGFINWGADLVTALEVVERYVPAAVWLFAPKNNVALVRWADEIRNATKGKTKIWIQVGTVADALELARLCKPDVLVVQGADAGGHGLDRGASIISLLPEVADALKSVAMGNINLMAAGGIAEGRGVAAALALGAHGVAMGTRFLASVEATVAKGYQDDVLRSRDGGISTARSRVYDTLRGINGWPVRYGGRGIINESFHDAPNGEVTQENMQRYQRALEKGDQGWGEHGRLTAYAGTGVGLIKDVTSARQILDDVRTDVKRIQQQNTSSRSRM